MIRIFFVNFTPILKTIKTSDTIHHMLSPMNHKDGFYLAVDCDSAYFFEHTLSKITSACGFRCSYTMNSHTKRFSSSKSTRFGFDATKLKAEKLYKNGNVAGVQNLSQVTNVMLMKCHFNELPGKVMAINMF